MKVKTRFIAFTTILFLIVPLCHSQQSIHFQDSQFQYGVTAKVVADLSVHLKKCNIRASVATGVGYLLYPTNLVRGALRGLGTYRNGSTSYLVAGLNTTQSFGESSQQTIPELYRNQPPVLFY